MNGRAHPAACDCERVRGGVLAQPVNAVSSLAYVVVGGELVARAGRSRLYLAAFGALVAVEGVGSVGFHGPGDRVSHRLHDLALGGTVAFVAAAEAVALVQPRRGGRRRRQIATTAALLTAATAINVLSRTGAPLCRPDGRLQGHAVWHLLTAAALRAWALATLTDSSM